MGQAQDGAGLGWTDASPKRNHRISSTKEERKGEERTKGQGAGGGRMKPEARGGGACVQEGRIQKGCEARRTIIHNTE